MNLANEWKDYEILDLYNGEKVERWGEIILIIRILLRICRTSLTVALLSSFRWRRHDNFIELIC